MFHQNSGMPQHNQHNYSGGLAYSYAQLQNRARRAPVEVGMGGVARPPTMVQKPGSTPNVEEIRNFYLKRLQQSQNTTRLPTSSQTMINSKPQAQGTLGSVASTSVGSGSTSTSSHRPRFTAEMLKSEKEVDVMCNLCFEMVKSSNVTTHARLCEALVAPPNPIDQLDMKLKKFRSALEARLCADQSNKHNLRTWTNLKYHLDAALKWTVGCAELGAVSDHTVREVKMLTSTARHLAPQMYVFAKRIENIITLKIAELKLAEQRAASPEAQAGADPSPAPLLAVDRPDDTDALDVQSVAEMNSDCGTNYQETHVTQSECGDVANLNDMKSISQQQNEDDARREFYSMCLAVKMACEDKEKSRRILISDLHNAMLEEEVPREDWKAWIVNRVNADEAAQIDAKPFDKPERDSLPRAAPPPTEQVPAVPNLAHMQRWENMRQQYQPVAGRMDEQTHNQRLQSEMQARLAASHKESEEEKLSQTREEMANAMLTRSSPSIRPFVRQQAPGARGHMAPFQNTHPSPYGATSNPNPYATRMDQYGQQRYAQPPPTYPGQPRPQYPASGYNRYQK